MYCVVPHCVTANASVDSSCFEIPKSESLTWPPRVRMQFAGFKSRCTWWRSLCKYCNPWSIWHVIIPSGPAGTPPPPFSPSLSIWSTCQPAERAMAASPSERA